MTLTMTPKFIFLFCLAEIITYAATYLMLSFVMPIKRSNIWKMWVVGYSFIILYLIILFCGHFDIMSNGVVLRLMVTIPEYYILPFLFAEKRPWKWVGFGLTNSFLLGFFVEGIFLSSYIKRMDKYSNITDLSKKLADIVYDDLGIFCVWMASVMVVNILLILCYRALLKREKAWNRFLNVTLVLGCTYMMIMVAAFLGGNDTNGFYGMIFACTHVACMSGSIIYGVYTEKKQAALKRKLLQMQLEVQSEQINKMIESQNNTRKKRHDLKNHIETIQMLIREDKKDVANEYVRKILSEYDQD